MNVPTGALTSKAMSAIKSPITSSLYCINLVRAIQSMSSVRVYQSRRSEDKFYSIAKGRRF